MSSTYITLPGNTFPSFNEISKHLVSLHTNKPSINLKNSLKDDKKVEVRWLESEAELYIKQWRKRYRQLEGIDDTSLHPISWTQAHLDNCDDWCLTAHTILDIDVSYMNSRDFNKFNQDNSNQGFDCFESRFMFNAFEEDEFELGNDEFPFETITIDSSIANQELIAALNASNLVFKNGKIETKNQQAMYGLNNINFLIPPQENEKTKVVNEKPTKKCQKNSPITDSSTQSSSNKTSNATTNSKGSKKKKFVRTKTKNATRRQIYICEFPGCSYQSDRNFNFLRHKRTHGKQKSEDKRGSGCCSNNSSSKHSSTNTTTATTSTQATSNDHLFVAQKNLLAGETSFEAATTASTTVPTAIELNQNGLTNLDHSSSASLLSSELNLETLSTQHHFPNNGLPVTISENGHSYLIGDHENYLQHQNIIMKDLNSLDHILADNHFASLTLDQSFLS